MTFKKEKKVQKPLGKTMEKLKSVGHKKTETIQKNLDIAKKAMLKRFKKNNKQLFVDANKTIKESKDEYLR